MRIGGQWSDTQCGLKKNRMHRVDILAKKPSQKHSRKKKLLIHLMVKNHVSQAFGSRGEVLVWGAKGVKLRINRKKGVILGNLMKRLRMSELRLNKGI